MTNKHLKFGTIIASAVAVVLLIFVCMSVLGDESKKKALDALYTESAESAQKYVPNLVMDTRLNDKTKVIGYYPVDKNEAAIPSLAQTLTNVLDTTKNRQSEQVDDVVVYQYQLSTRLSQLQSYDLHELVYRYKDGKYVVVSDAFIATQYMTAANVPITFEGLLANDFLDKDRILSALVANVKANVSDSEKENILKKLTADNFKHLLYKYTEDEFSLVVTKDNGDILSLALNVDDLVAYFNKKYIFSNKQSVYDSKIAAINAQREADEAEKSKQLVDKIKASAVGKKIALTLDDGPSPQTTPQVLDLFQKHNIKATFFVVGAHVAGNEDILKRELAEGHEIGNHSWSHPNLTKISLEEAIKQVEDTQQAIEQATGMRPKMLRPPYGAYNATIAKEVGLPILLWNIDSEDWKDRSPAILAEKIPATIPDGSIILVHDIHQSTIDGLETVVMNLKAAGYEFVTVSELVGADNLVPNVVYFSANDVAAISE